MSLRQIFGNYVKAEDRLLFRFTTSDHEEIRLWLTRSITATLISLGARLSVNLQEEKHSPSVAKALDAFQQEKNQFAVESASSFESQAKLPIGAAPILVIKADLNTRKVPVALPPIYLRLTLSTQQALDLCLTQSEFDQIRTLLDLLWKKANWSVPLEKAIAPAVGALLTPKPDRFH